MPIGNPEENPDLGRNAVKTVRTRAVIFIQRN